MKNKKYIVKKHLTDFSAELLRNDFHPISDTISIKAKY